jgi:hypothetical protein
MWMNPLRGGDSNRKNAQPRFIGKKGWTDVPLDPPWVQADVRVKSFALAFVSMLCATVIGFASEFRPLNRIHQTMATMKRSELRPPSYPARLQSNCSGASQGTAEASNAGSDWLRISAMATHAAMLLNASVTSRE